MKVLYRDPRGKKLKLFVETLDDLWHLYNLIEKEDLVYGLGYRREERAKDRLRPERREKKRMWMGLRVESTEFHEFSDRLRVHGIIEEAPEDIGSHHTLNIVARSEVTVVKSDWKAHHLQRLEHAVKAAKRPIITIVAIEYDNAVIALLRDYGIQEVARIHSHASGKQYREVHDYKSEFYGEVLGKLKQLRQESEGEGGPLILIGPGFAKDEFREFGREREASLFARSYIGSTGQGGMIGVQEALKSGVVGRVAEECRVALETQVVEQLLEEIAKDGLFAYGAEEVRNALEVGAVETLLVTNEMVREGDGIELLELAERGRSRIMVVSSVHEGGKKLKALGGVGAILRYKV